MPFIRRAGLCGLAFLAGAVAAAPATTVDALATHSQLNAGLANGEALNLRIAHLLGGDDVLRAELLDERKFGSRGGIAGAGFSKGLSADWFASAGVALGHGGPNWANRRIDLGLGVKVGAQRDTIVQLGIYQASYDQARRDRGLIVGLVAYRFWPLVLQVGVTANVSDPGSVSSAMFNASATWGQEGEQFLTLRLARGSESYQALGAGSALADFDSRSLALSWRRWLGAGWGLQAQAEQYHNPSYDRLTLGAALFAQF